MSGKYSGDLVLMDSIPACASDSILDVHKAWVQVSGKRETFVKDQCDAVIAMARRMDNFSIQANSRKKFSRVFQFQHKIIVLCDGNVGEILSFEKFGKGRDEVILTFQYDQLYALIF